MFLMLFYNAMMEFQLLMNIFNSNALTYLHIFQYTSPCTNRYTAGVMDRQC